MIFIFKRYVGSVRGYSNVKDKDKLARVFDDICGKGSINSVGWCGSGLFNICGWRVLDCCIGMVFIRDRRWFCLDR